MDGNLQGEKARNKQRQVNRWLHFMDEYFLPFFDDHKRPKEISFTGGGALKNGLAEALRERRDYVKVGPMDSGLKGAAIIAKGSKPEFAHLLL